jgi:hypothetical protein
MVYSVPVLNGSLPDKYLNHWVILLRAYDLCLKWDGRMDDLDTIQSLLVQFVAEFKTLYVDCDNHPKRARLYSTNIHGLLHLHDQIVDCGPMFAWDESSTESYMGAIQPLARSGVKIDESAANATFLEEMIKTLSYARPQIGFRVCSGRQHRLNERAYETELGYLLPVVDNLHVSDLTTLQRRRLAEYFNTLIGHRVDIARDAEVKRWARYQIKSHWEGQKLSGHTIGSVISQRPGPVTRASHWIRYQLIHSRQDRTEVFLGQVEFFLSLTVKDVVGQSRWKRGSDGRLIREQTRSSTRSSDESSMDVCHDSTGDDSACEHYLAYVRNWHTRAFDEDTGDRRVKFIRNGAYEFIELRAIDCAVGKMTTFQGE